jgi:tRNA nucleotidyltransferase (CCA-adding enzyme)
LQVDPHQLGELLETALPVALRHVPFRIRDVARETDMRVALAGGVPRDLLRLHLRQIDRDGFIAGLRDFDIAVEGDGVRFAYELARRLPGALTVNERFHTATLATSDPLQIDITTARLEEYPEPGKLPVVDVSGVSLEQDLARRDFSVNALALDLSHDFGQLLDPQGGAGDVDARLVRVLHPGSFIDDPTRLFRALRYALRLNYDIEPATRALYAQALDEAVLDHLTPERVRYELECFCGEERWADLWVLMDFSRLAAAVSPLLAGISAQWDMDDARALDIALGNRPELLAGEQVEAWVARLAWCFSTLDEERIELISERAGIFPRHQRWLRLARGVLRSSVMAATDETAPSAITRELEHFPRQSVLLAALVYQPRMEAGVAARKRLLRYLDVYTQVRCELGAEELIELGLRPGQQLGRIRDELRYMHLDGQVASVEDERAYVLQQLQPPAEHNSAPEEHDGAK